MEMEFGLGLSIPAVQLLLCADKRKLQKKARANPHGPFAV